MGSGRIAKQSPYAMMHCSMPSRMQVADSSCESAKLVAAGDVNFQTGEAGILAPTRIIPPTTWGHPACPQMSNLQQPQGCTVGNQVRRSETLGHLSKSHISANVYAR